MSIYQQRLDEERARLRHPLAFSSADSRGRRVPEPADTIRTHFERDGHRIVHSKPFRRLRNKTQVFFSPENDHIATRIDHSLYVATIARTICRALGLNDDLAFAAALGHDIGHSAFGHSGERILRRLLNRGRPPSEPARAYLHEEQSLRVADMLSRLPGHDFVGMNLTYEVRDAIRCHCGESIELTLRPRPRDQDDDPSAHQGLHTYPITLEGCVVRLADRIAYLGRDYEDAQVALGDLPPLPRSIRTTLGGDNRSIINTLVLDVIEQNQRQPDEIGFSAAVAEAALELRSFNYTHIYGHPRLDENRARMDVILSRIFDTCEDHLRAHPRELWSEVDPEATFHLRALTGFIAGAGYEEIPDAARVLVDWISLMTDGFAFKVFECIALPRPVV